jgi:hypothetical protein
MPTGVRFVKKLLSILSYLPIVLLGFGGSLVVFDMWHIAGVGRKKVAVVEHGSDTNPIATPSPESPATRATP